MGYAAGDVIRHKLESGEATIELMHSLSCILRSARIYKETWRGILDTMNQMEIEWNKTFHWAYDEVMKASTCLGNENEELSEQLRTRYVEKLSKFKFDARMIRRRLRCMRKNALETKWDGKVPNSHDLAEMTIQQRIEILNIWTDGKRAVRQWEVDVNNILRGFQRVNANCRLDVQKIIQDIKAKIPDEDKAK